MFIPHYKLNEQPFGVTPDPKFLYLTPTHREAIASIVYGVMENRGFSALIAPPGMGKTTLLFELLQRLGDSARTVFLFQFQPTPEGLLRNLLAELGAPEEGLSFEAMQEKLNQLILQESSRGKRIVVVVDEAQNFREPVLEVLRMLSNFETRQAKLIHIILSGQPQLAEILSSPAVEQLRQRISIMAVLRPLSAKETQDYIDHRLRVAGYRGQRPIFTSAARERIARYSGGIPRNINNLCFNAMSLGYALGRSTIEPALIDEVLRDLNLDDVSQTTALKMPEPHGARPAKFTPASTPEMWPRPTKPTGTKLRFAAGVLSFSAVLCVGGIFAKQYADSRSGVGVSLRAPAPPVPQVEIAPPAASEPAADAPSQAIQAQSEQAPERPRIVSRQKPKTLRQRVPEKEQVPVKLVRASRRETLYDLCTKNLETCDVKTIYEIRRLNPSLGNETQLESGQAVRMPIETSSKKRLASNTFTRAEGKP